MPQLAALGGPPVAPEGLRSEWPAVTYDDRAAVLRALNSGQWSRVDCRQASEVSQFEDEFARAHDARFCLALASGTAALQVALRAAGVGFGDEVIVSTVTWYASAAAIIHCGAVPVFADIVPDTYQLDITHAEALITPRTRAVIAVHYAGYPCDLDALKSLAARDGLAVIEDCAHAHGTAWRGRRVGAHLAAGGFSFQESKALTCGEGGALLTDDERLIARAFAHHHLPPIASRPFVWLNAPAPNFRLAELPAALLRSQLTRLGEQTAIRERHGTWLAEELRRLGGVEPLRADARITQRGYYFFVARYDATQFGDVPRAVFVNALRAEGIHVGMGYEVPLHRLGCFTEHNFDGLEALVRFPDYAAQSLPVAEHALAEEQLTFTQPLLLYARNCELVVATIMKLRNHLDELRSLAKPE